MTLQYLREWRVVVNGVELSGDDTGRGFKVRFDTHQALSSTPHHANIYIYNLSAQTLARMQKEKGRVELYAGYRGASGKIFGGQAIQVRAGRENVVDSYVHVLATSSEDARNYAVTNEALAKGHTLNDRLQLAVKSMREHGVKPGTMDNLGSRQFPRNYVFSGMTHDLLREVCEAAGATWHIHDDKLTVLKSTGTLPGGVIEMNSETGMVGLPEQTLGGVIVRCLLNPRIYPGSRIHINESSIQRAGFSPATRDSAQNVELESGLLSLAADGIYKVWQVGHVGDTRGDPWWNEMVCTKQDLPLAAKGLMLPDGIPGDGAQP